MTATGPIDVAIAGGGLVGISLALALHGRGYRTLVIEPRALDGQQPPPSFDDRAIALSRASRQIFAGMGLWGALSTEAAPIRNIHVSDKGHFGITRMRAGEMGLDALGHVVPARAIGVQLYRAFNEIDDASLMAPGRVERIEQDAEQVHLEIERGGISDRVSARLLVVADGAESSLREQLGVQVHRLDYGHYAVTANVRTSRAPDGWAYERFTEDGPVAMLPMGDDRSAMVYTIPAQQLQRVLALTDRAFLRELQARFGYRLGRFEQLGRRDAYPLQLVRAKQSHVGRAVIIGNAAHTLHPIAGQGFNLGLRDVAALAECIQGDDAGASEVLDTYDSSRRRDQQGVTWGTDILARLFVNPLPPVRLGRNLGLVAMELLPPVRKQLTRLAMGLGQQRPQRWVR